MAKLLIISAPSGSGKSTLIGHLMGQVENLHFSVSATSRAPRGTEKDGVEYYFLTPEEFREKIAKNEFLEYCEVYEDKFYGTLKSEVDQKLKKGKNVVCDVDVIGAENIKKIYGKRALSVFIAPPSIQVLRERLVKRDTDTLEVIEDRIRRAEYEMSFADKFDKRIINDDLETAKAEIVETVVDFINSK